MKRFSRSSASLLVLAALLGACSTKRPTASVAVKLFRFQPETLAVKAGTSVTWTNSDQILHTATSGTPGHPSGVFSGEMPDAGRSFSFTFSSPGTYAYFCMRHPSTMQGKVVVG